MKKVCVLLITFCLLFSMMPVDAASRTKVKPIVKPTTTTTPTTTTPTTTTPTTTTPTTTTPTTTTPTTNNYGLIKNDASQRDNNAKMLTQALNQYGSITLDGIFYIGNTSEVVTNPNVTIAGLNGTEFIFDKGRKTDLFVISKIKNLTVTNMKFTNTSTETLYMAYEEQSSSKVESVKIDGCSFEGNISVYRQMGDTSLNPQSVDFGIGEFIFTNNTITDSGFTFIKLNDVPFNKVEISNNIIHNFSDVIAYLGITNGSPFEAQMVTARKYIKVSNNKVTCDDSYWVKAGITDYYCFVLTENAEVLYDSNYVEGMKADYDVALYDAYLSSTNVTYTNNTWINNICFTAAKTNNSLIKSKQGGVGGDAGNEVIVNRIYSNNTFIVEESFADRVGHPKNELFITFMELTTLAENYTIENNNINVYDLRFPVSSKQIRNFKFNNNKISSKYALGCLGIIRLTDNFQPTIEMNGNNIQIAQTTEHPSGLTDDLTFMKIVDARSNTANSLAKSIVVKDNIIHGPFDYIFEEPLADMMVAQNNDISVVNNLFSGLVYGGNHPELTNNVLVAKY